MEKTAKASARVSTDGLVSYVALRDAAYAYVSDRRCMSANADATRKQPLTGETLCGKDC